MKIKFTPREANNHTTIYCSINNGGDNFLSINTKLQVPHGDFDKTKGKVKSSSKHKDFNSLLAQVHDRISMEGSRLIHNKDKLTNDWAKLQVELALNRMTEEEVAKQTSIYTIKSILKYLGMTAYQLAKQIGYKSHNSVYNLESGARPITKQFAKKFVMYYPEVNFLYLMGESTTMILDKGKRGHQFKLLSPKDFSQPNDVILTNLNKNVSEIRAMLEESITANIELTKEVKRLKTQVRNLMHRTKVGFDGLK